jgi:transcription termination factor Rho
MSNQPNGTPEIGSGYLEISEKGFGFLRSPENHFHPKPTDIFVTAGHDQAQFPAGRGALCRGRCSRRTAVTAPS